MNRNFYIDQLTKRVERLEKIVSLLEDKICNPEPK